MTNAPTIEAVVLLAGLQPDGSVLTADVLRACADGVQMFWDEKRQALIYRGPMPRGWGSL